MLCNRHILAGFSQSSLSPQPQEVPKPQQASGIFMYFYVNIMLNLQVLCISDKVQLRLLYKKEQEIERAKLGSRAPLDLYYSDMSAFEASSS